MNKRCAVHPGKWFILFLIVSLGSSIVPARAQLSPTAEQDATVLTKWMQLLYERAEADSINAPAAARLYAYAGVTAYQAVLGGIPEGISMEGQLNGLSDLPLPDPHLEYDWSSVANAALATVMSGLFPEGSEQSQSAFQAMREELIKTRLRTISPEILTRSLDYGDTLGEAILEWSASDNYLETRDLEYTVETGDAAWVPTRDGMMAVEAYWGRIRPFALYDADSCAVAHNMAFDTRPASTFYKQAMEVKQVGDQLTREQKDIARYWVDTPGETGTPAGHWVLIENQIVDVLNLKLDRAAMMYGLVNIALGDAFISAWSLKYQVNLLRPETYINRYIDRRWQPFIQTPGFPEYPSGHSVASAAAAEVLTQMFGPVAFTDRSGRKHGLGERSFTSFEAAASEAAISRLYGGIHFREAIENGMRQGRCVGRNVLDYVVLRSIPQGE